MALPLSPLLKLPPRKWSLEICFMEFLSLNVALYLYKSTIPSIEYCYHICSHAPSCCLELLEKLQERVCRTVGSSLALS